MVAQVHESPSCDAPSVPGNAPYRCFVGAKNRAGDFFWGDGKNAGFNRTGARKLRRENGDVGTMRASGVRYFGFRYYSADMGRFIHADPLEERGAWALYGDLSYGTTNPFFGSSGLGGKSWLSEWEQVQDGLTRNASFSHSTEEVQFSTLRNSGFVGSYEQNKKFYSANAGVTIGQGGSHGLEFDTLDIGTMTYSGFASPSYRNIDTNLYAYVGNNPFNIYDPLGLFGWGDFVDYTKAAASGAAGGLYGATVGAATETFNQGKQHMEQGFQAIADGNYVEGALHVTAALGSAADVGTSAVTGGVGKTGAIKRVFGAADNVRDAARSSKAAVGAADKVTSRTARRQAMRDADQPTTRSATSQSGAEGRRQYTTEGHDGKPQVQSQHPADKKHPQPHWHNSTPKTDPNTGEILTNRHGQVKYKKSDSTTATYDDHKKRWN